MPINDHKSLPDSELHNPKGFADASVGRVLWKNYNSELEWVDLGVQPAVLDLVDINSAPPTESDGDRYIVINVSSSVAHADWDSPSVDDIVEYHEDEDEWKAYTPTEGTRCYDKDSNADKLYITSWT